MWGNTSLEFREIVRRIKKEKAILIKEKIAEVTQENIDYLMQTISNPTQLFNTSSFIHNPLFPYTALRALKEGAISVYQFGTLMKFWGRMSEVLPDTYQPQFIPLFLADGKRNPQAIHYLKTCLSASTSVLLTKSPEQLLNGIYAHAANLTPLEQGFYVAAARTDKSIYTDTPVFRNRQEYFSSHTITQEIKHSTQIYMLDLPKGNKEEILAGIELFQIYLNVAFKYPVRINPVIGISSVEEIRAGSMYRYRDVGLAFPGIELPKKADNFPAPSSLDFIFHDDYHCVRASSVAPEETKIFIAIADRLNQMQYILNETRKNFSERHKIHKERYQRYDQKLKIIDDLTPKDRLIYTFLKAIHLKKLYNESSIISALSQLSISIGQLKFRLYDMEHFFPGKPYVKQDGPVLQFIRIMGNIELHAKLLGKPQGSKPLLKRHARFIAHAVLDAYLIKQSHLKTAQQLIRNNLKFSFIEPNLRKLDECLLEKASTLTLSVSNNFITELDKKIDYYSTRELFFKQKKLDDKRELYSNIKDIFIASRKQYLKSPEDNDARKNCLEEIIRQVQQIETNIKINERRNIITYLLQEIKSLFVKFGLFKQEEVKPFKVADFTHRLFKSINTTTVKDIHQIVTKQQGFILEATISPG